MDRRKAMSGATYFESWTEVADWIEGMVFDNPDIEAKVDKILHPEKI